MSIRPYTISVPDEKLKDLKARLALAAFPSQLEGVDEWEFGTPTADIKRLTKYWRDGFDWRKAEAKLNKLPNFKTTIDVDGFGDIDLHFVHQTSPVKGAIPLLFSHGWPGSFIEVTKLLPLLTNGGPDTPTFHVVAPSLPNFGFSGGVNKQGFGVLQYGETLHKLMLKLGYDQYVTQGGDWGFSTTRAIALQYPTHCLASHLNLVLANTPTLYKSPYLYLLNLLSPSTPRSRAAHARSKWFAKSGYAYNLLQQTKPQTVAHLLSDSPTGLLAWIYEKLHDWTDGPYDWSDDEILTWVSIYWFSVAGPAASVRIYYEANNYDNNEIGTRELQDWIPHVKLGLAHFPREIHCVPMLWGRTLGPVVWQKEHEKGGHFAAWEVPEAVVGDLRGMFGKEGPCFGIVRGRCGFDE